LKQAAIDQQAGRGIHIELVAGAGHAVLGAVVFDVWKIHTLLL